MTQPLTPPERVEGPLPAPTPEVAAALMAETARMLSYKIGIVIEVDGQFFVMGAARLTVDEMVNALCQQQAKP